MRVIAGTAKGHKLVAPKSKLTRPVLDQVKEAIFNILCSVEGFRVLDLFAGSGAVGIEALSRGALHCTFVDAAREAIDCIQKNLAHCRLSDKGRTIPLRVAVALKKLNRDEERFDLIFVDPPYEQNLVNPTLKLLAQSSLLRDGGEIIVEHHPKEPVDLQSCGLALTEERRYGQTAVSFLRKP